MEQTVILNLEVDQTQAHKQLVQTEKNILSLKKEQAELNKEYKEGKITQDQYVKANLNLQKAIKTETTQKNTLNKALQTESGSRDAMRQKVAALNKEYNSLNLTTEKGLKRSKELAKELTHLTTELNKGSKAAGQFKDNIGNYPDQLAKATNEIKPFGLSVDGATSSIAKFATPATAAIGILAGLTTAYLSSSAGAKDLAFAQDRLSFITSSLVETLGTLVSGSGEGGEGALNKLLDVSIDFLKTIPEFAIANALLAGATGKSVDQINAQSKALAKAREELRKLEIESTRAQGFAKFFENAAENARRIRDDEEKILEERLKASNTVEQNLQANQTVRLNVINKEIEAIKKANVNWQNQDNIVLQIEQKRAETRDIEEEINGKLTENFTARQKILTQIQGIARAERRASSGGAPEASPDPLQDAFSIGETSKKQELDMTERFNERIAKANKKAADDAIAQKQREADGRLLIEQTVQEAQLSLTAGFLAAASSLFEQGSGEYKLLASAQTLISTYASAQKAFESMSGIPIAGPALGAAAAALAVVQGLANVAAINGVQFAEGGYTGAGGKYQPAGIVHAGEVVWNQEDVARAGGPAAANAMRPTAMRGYADGGFVTNQNIAATQQAMITANAIKNLPQPIIGVREFATVQKRVEVREQSSKI